MSQQSHTTTSAAPQGSLLLDLKGAAVLLGLTVWQLRGLISNKEIPVIQIGRKFYIRRAAAIRWAERAEA